MRADILTYFYEHGEDIVPGGNTVQAWLNSRIVPKDKRRRWLS